MSSARRLLFVFLLASISLPATALAQGLILPGAGAANRAMAGASTAAPLDAAGAAYWNPAAISGLPQNEIYFGAELIYADTRVGASPLPPAGDVFSGTGLTPIPTTAMVYHLEDSPITVGVGIYGAVGGAANYPTQLSNPALTPKTNQYASASVLQLVPTISMQVTERLAVGVSPMIDVCMLSLDPAFFANNGDNTFPAATHGRPFWGGGFQVGAYYELNPCWSFGLAYKSTQWFETMRWNALGAGNQPREVTLELTLPRIISWGFAYKGIECTTIAMDFRYLDYADTKTFGQPVVEGGTGWKSVFAVATGIERRMGERCKLRMGYLFNENPIPEVLTLFNTQLPTISQHQLSLGFSAKLTRQIAVDFAWVHGFENSISGPVPPTQLPGGNTVTMTQSLDAWIFGTSVCF